MTGTELRRIMRVRRIKTVEAAHALGIHPQTIRNLWAKDEVPRLYLMALTSYVWALGMDPMVMACRVRAPEGEELKWARGVAKKLEAKPTPPPVRTGESAGGDLWSKLK
jgi:hypothetical protein